MRQHTVIILVLLLSTIGVYYQVSHCEFIAYDDDGYVGENQRVQQGLSRSNLWWALTSCTETNWHPITWLSHMLDCQLFGPDQSGWYHLVNLLFHVTNSVLLYVVFHQMTGCCWKPAFAAILFAIHPLHVESVAWIAERKDVLSTFLGLLSLICYVHYSRYMSRCAYFLSILFLALGLASKPMLVTLPFLFLLLDYWPLERLLPPKIIPQQPGGKTPTGRRRPDKQVPVPSGDPSNSLAKSPTHVTGVEPSHQPRSLTSTTGSAKLFVEKAPMFLFVIASSVITYYAQSTSGALAPLTWEKRSGPKISPYFIQICRTCGTTGKSSNRLRCSSELVRWSS